MGMSKKAHRYTQRQHWHWALGNHFRHLNFFLKTVLLTFCLATLLQAKNAIAELFPSTTRYSFGHHGLEDPENGSSLRVEHIEASHTIKDNSGMDYSIQNVLGGPWDNSWCVNGDGIGEWIMVKLPEKDILGVQKGMLNLYRILLTNGLVVVGGGEYQTYNENNTDEEALKESLKPYNKQLYYANNRVKKIEVEFSEGQKYFLNLTDSDLHLQRFTFNIKAKWVKFTIREIYKGKKYNDTCISKMFFETKWPVRNQ
jgi:hypothetical protein